MMSYEGEISANYFLELASIQRLQIIFTLYKQKSKISEIAKKIDATIQEVSRNFDRLEKAGLIVKQQDRFYELSTFGRLICLQTPSIIFISKNEKYFKEHSFGNLPLKFIQRIGAMNNSELINGNTRVMEKWKSIHNNSKEYIYNLLIDVPYSMDLMEVIESKLKKRIKVKSVFSENAIVPTERKKIFERYDFEKYVKDELLERKMAKDIKISLVLNEKEALICFPLINGGIDLSKGFFSKDKDFHEWCLDFFKFYLDSGKRFREDTLDSE